ncbi:MAG TPA: hypothetical protein VKC66_13500 [Xanthobacteraceae bacterium]|nr:hypothetical protein [Xanthobacteraceae bacterium]
MVLEQRTTWGEPKRPATAGRVSGPLDAVALVNPGELQRFIDALLRYADKDSFVSLRTLDRNARGGPPRSIKGIKVGDPHLIDEVEALAIRAARAADPRNSFEALHQCR